MQGLIVKSTGGFYYVETSDKQVIECRARGKFRNEGIMPLVGDKVEFDKAEDSIGYIQSIEERSNSMVRPAIANVDQVVIVASAKEPDFSSYLLNTFLALVEHKNIKPVIAVTKCDLLDPSDPLNESIDSFINDGYDLIKINNTTGEGVDVINDSLKDKITVFTGQTGVGKSTTLNSISPELAIATQEISKALGRGKHTTRHVELFDINCGKVADTPGFSSLELIDMTPEDLANSYKIFAEASEKCKFRNCLHDSEKNCAVKEAVENGTISKIKYNDYMKLLNKLKEGKKW